MKKCKTEECGKTRGAAKPKRDAGRLGVCGTVQWRARGTEGPGRPGVGAEAQAIADSHIDALRQTHAHTRPRVCAGVCVRVCLIACVCAWM